MGLKITDEFVKKNNGEIIVSSKPGKGNCFEIRLAVSATYATLQHKKNNEVAKDTESDIPVDYKLLKINTILIFQGKSA